MSTSLTESSLVEQGVVDPGKQAFVFFITMELIIDSTALSLLNGDK